MTIDPDYIEATTPTAVQVAQRLWARTKEHGGQTVGEFNDNTRPTRAEVDAFIASSVGEVTSICPLLSSDRWALGREAAVIRTCMKIELAYRPEQANDSESAYYLLRQEWLDLMGGGPGGQRGSLCGSGGSGDGDGVEGWQVDTVPVHGIAAGRSDASGPQHALAVQRWTGVQVTEPEPGAVPAVTPSVPVPGACSPTHARQLNHLTLPGFVNEPEPVCEDEQARYYQSLYKLGQDPRHGMAVQRQ